MRIIRLGLWLGLVYGFVEGLAFWVLGFIPGVLAWQNANAYFVLAFAPLFYGAVGLALACVVALVAKAAPRLPWEAILVGLYVASGAYLLARLPEVLWPIACLVLAAGVGVQAARLYAGRASLRQMTARTLPHLLGALAVVGVVVMAWAPVRDRIGLSRVARGGAGKPNVVLLVIDTQRADHLSSYGYTRPTTPNIDKLAREGTLFENAYSGSSWTLPSHAGMFTGRPMHEHHAGLLRRPVLDHRYPTLAEALAADGYATGGFIANFFWVGRQTGLARGFMHYEDVYGNLGDAIARTVLGRMVWYEWLPHWTRVNIPGRKSAGDVNREMLAWLDKVGDRPFFAFANYLDVHTPRFPPKETQGTFGWKPEFEQTSGVLDLGRLEEQVHVPVAEEMARRQAAYDESLLYVDRQIGLLMDELKRRGKLDNTIVIVTGDHGESYGEHGMLAHGHSLWRDQIHVPLVVRYPAKVAAGVRAAAPVSNVWLPATIQSLTGARGAAFPGVSLFAPATASRDDTVLVEVGRRSMVLAQWPTSQGWLAGLLADRWHFIERQDGQVELYDVVADPNETKNLANTSEGELAVATFRARLNAHGVAELGARMRLRDMFATDAPDEDSPNVAERVARRGDAGGR